MGNLVTENAWLTTEGAAFSKNLYLNFSR